MQKRHVVAYFNIGGSSYPHGYNIDFATVNGLDGRVSVRINATDADALSRPDATAIIFCVALALTAGLIGMAWPVVFGAVLILDVGTGWFFDDRWKSWHWVEHQTAAAIERDVPFDRMHTLNPAMERCGSMSPITAAVVIAVATASLEHPTLWAWPLYATTLAAYLAVRTRRATCDCIRCNRRFRRWQLLRWVGWPAIMLGLGLQRLLFLRRPTQRQMNIAQHFAIETAKRIGDALIMPPAEPVIRYRPGMSV